jgi:hypothetical protein
MKRVKATIIDSCGNVYAEVLPPGHYVCQVGEYFTLPVRCQSGTLIQLELMMTDPNPLDPMANG